MSLKNITEALLSYISMPLRMFPIATEAGLIKFGNPTPDSPVFVTGNYIHTARKVKQQLKGKDCYLLLADSAGINVWCAAGVGDFNEHKIADAVNASGLKDLVKHRTLILPQLAAVGVDKKKLFKECGFHVEWGPANYQDIGKYFANGLKMNDTLRLVNFPLEENLILTLGKLFAYYFFYLYYFIYAYFYGGHYHKYAAFIAIVLFINFGFTVIPLKKPFKWPATYILSLGLLELIAIGCYGYYVNPAIRGDIPFYLISTALISLLVAMDTLANHHIKTTIGHWLKTFNCMSLFQPKINKNCTNCGQCISVCPKGVLYQANGTTAVDAKKICCECLACMKQCPADAIDNRNKGIYKKDVKVIPNIEQIMNR